MSSHHQTDQNVVDKDRKLTALVDDAQDAALIWGPVLLLSLQRVACKEAMAGADLSRCGEAADS